MKIPSQYLPVMPYLVIHNANGFLEFTKSVLGATVQEKVSGENDTIMHAEIRINDAVIMLGDAGDNWPEKPSAMFIYVPEVDATYAKAIEHGAKSLEKPSQKEYGYNAAFEDPFGNHWFIVEPEK